MCSWFLSTWMLFDVFLDLCDGELSSRFLWLMEPLRCQLCGSQLAPVYDIGVGSTIGTDDQSHQCCLQGAGWEIQHLRRVPNQQQSGFLW